MVVVHARLDPEAGAVLRRALDAAAQLLAARVSVDMVESDSAEQRRADALGLIAESALAGGLDPGSRGDRYQVVVHVDSQALVEGGTGHAAFEEGTRVSAETSRRLACDCARVVMVHDGEGAVLDVGRRKRTISPGLRRALEHRDRGCRFPGCGLRLCDAHHVEHWADGGATRLGNLVLLCRRHHRAVHEEGFRVDVLVDGELRFTRPDGRVLLPAPTLPGLAAGAATLLARLETHGTCIDPAAGLPSWDGRPLDLALSLDAFRALDSPRETWAHGVELGAEAAG